MEKKNTYICWLLLMVMLMAVTVMGLVEPTYAHYEETVVWNTVLTSDGSPVSSDCLVAEGQQTILLGTIPVEGKEISFTLEAAQTASGVLTWTVDKPEYLTVQLQKMELKGNGTLSADPSADLEDQNVNYPALQGGSMVTVSLLLVPGNNVPQDTEVNVTVQWGTLLRGVFQGTVCESQEIDSDQTETPEDSTEEPTEPTEETTEPTEETELTEETQPADQTDTVDTTDQDSQIVLLSLTETEDTIPEETTPEETIPEETTPEETVPEETIPEETTPEEPSEEPTPEEPDTEAIVQQISALGSFSKDGWLPVSIQPMADADRLVLSVKSAEDATAQWAAFPSFTRYSIDGGESWYLLYESDYITIDAADEAVMLLLDFSWKARTAQESLLLQAEGYSADALQESYKVKTTPNMDLSELSEMQFLTQDQTTVEVAVPAGWEHCTMEYNVEMLCQNSEGEITYQTVTLSSDSLNATYTPAKSGSAGKMLLQLGRNLPPAGTYRLNISWTYQGLCFHEEQMTFFINYSNFAQTEGTGGAEQ